MSEPVRVMLICNVQRHLVIAEKRNCWRITVKRARAQTQTLYFCSPCATLIIINVIILTMNCTRIFILFFRGFVYVCMYVVFFLYRFA